MSAVLDDIRILEEQIYRQGMVEDAIVQYGLTQSALAILKSSRYYNDTALSTLGLEAIDPSHDEIALEAIGNDIREKSAQWSAKIIGFFNDGTKAITEKISSLWDSVKAKIEPFTTAAWDAAKSAASVVKAHPYKTILIALAAVASAFAVVSFVGTSLPVGAVTNGKMQSFMLRLQTAYSNINLPAGKMKTIASMDGRLVLATIETAEKPIVGGSVASLGWTLNTAKAIYTKANHVFDGGVKALGSFWTKVLKPGEKILATILLAPKDLREAVVGNTGMRSAGWLTDQIVPALYYSILFKMCRNLYDILSEVVSDAIRKIRDTFAALKPAVL